ncbi:hypothetical protein FQR65_LT16277 [Abscondita terminalis]|nr:hypothetical protein FQR65_LT16277 [Abscondita terminalis]
MMLRKMTTPPDDILPKVYTLIWAINAPLKHLGYKAVVVNLSDLAAMNAVPSQILVSLAASNRFPVEAFEELYAGETKMTSGCNRDLGGAYMGLTNTGKRTCCLFGKSGYMQPEMEGYDYILQRQLKPEARTDIRTTLEEMDIVPTSMIDISDGLASEILHLSDQSKVGFHLYEEKIPMDTQMINTAEELNFNPVIAALNGGEDCRIIIYHQPG